MSANIVKPLPMPMPGKDYDQTTERRRAEAVGDELRHKFDRRADLALQPGKRLVLASPGNLQYALGLDDGGKLTVTNYADGTAGLILIDWAEVDGAAAFETRVETLEAVASGLSGTYATITYVNTVESDLEASIATTSSNLTAAFTAGDATNAAAITSEAITRATADTALSVSISSLSATVGGHTASISTLSSAIATAEDAMAEFYVIAAATGGTPARIGLKSGLGGSVVILDAEQIYFGAQTTFDTGTETFITTAGSVKSRYGTAFGAGGSQVVMWHGPSAVALGSESRTNGYLAIGTDGSIYHNAAALGWGATASAAAASNALVPLGENMLTNTDWHQSTAFPPLGWQSGWDGTAGMPIYRGSALGGWSDNPVRTLYAYATGAPAVDTVFDVVQSPGHVNPTNAARWAPRVIPGERYYASAYYGCHRCKARTTLYWIDVNGNVIGQSDWTSAPNAAPFYYGDPSYAIRVGGFATAPANAKYAYLAARAVGTGESVPYLFFGWPMFARASATQTVEPAYSSGRTDRFADVTGSNTAAAISGQGALATLSSAADGETGSQGANVTLTTSAQTICTAATLVVPSGISIGRIDLRFSVDGASTESGDTIAYWRVLRDGADISGWQSFATLLASTQQTYYDGGVAQAGDYVVQNYVLKTVIADFWVDTTVTAGNRVYSLQAHKSLSHGVIVLKNARIFAQYYR